MIILPANSLTGGFEVANSCRFNDGDSSYLHITPSAGNRDRFTFSCWVKRGVLGAANALFTVLSGSNYSEMYFGSSNQIYWDEYPGSLVGRLITNRVFRDCSAWYHLVFVYDSANATAGNRMRLYVNGVEETSFATDTQPSSGQDSFFNGNLKHMIGGHTGGSEWVDGYMAEVVFCDGQAYAASDFGEFDEDSPTIWKPKDVSGLTFGTNGFYLDFEDSANLGNDANGGTDLTEVNLAAADQATDTPTNNFATFNPLAAIEPGEMPTFSEGNCQGASTSGGHISGISTIAVNTGKWYAEFKISATSNTAEPLAGVIKDNVTSLGTGSPHDSALFYGARGNGTKYTASTGATSWGANWALNDIISLAVDLDNQKLYVAKGGSWSDGSGNYDESSPNAYVDLSDGDYFYFCLADASGGETGTWQANFGGCPAFAISSGNADANGYGNFEYAVPSGYLALCTKNLGSDGG